jgi:hypothetical protein
MCDVSGWHVSNHAEAAEYNRGRPMRPVPHRFSRLDREITS